MANVFAYSFSRRASMASGAAFHRAYLRAMQQAFLEAHQLAFHYFGGIFHKLRYDNLKSAVKRLCVARSAWSPSPS
jgi:transposase